MTDDLKALLVRLKRETTEETKRRKTELLAAHEEQMQDLNNEIERLRQEQDARHADILRRSREALEALRSGPTGNAFPRHGKL